MGQKRPKTVAEKVADLDGNAWRVIRAGLLSRRDSYQSMREQCFTDRAKKMIRPPDGMVYDYKALSELFGQLAAEADAVLNQVDRALLIED